MSDEEFHPHNPESALAGIGYIDIPTVENVTCVLYAPIGKPPSKASFETKFLCPTTRAYLWHVNYDLSVVDDDALVKHGVERLRAYVEEHNDRVEYRRTRERPRA